ncbi:MAG: ABC transporter permease [Rhizobiales bacterium]|nr:ABC transporter permease [Hyphomicrobiales bacterium]
MSDAAGRETETTGLRHDRSPSALADVPLIPWLLAGCAVFWSAFLRWPTWLRLGWTDFQVAHRRTVIGPLWQVVQVGIWVVGLTLVFRQALAASAPNYMAYVAIGVVLWNFMSAAITQGANGFVRHAGLIRDINNPILIYPFRILANNLIKLLVQASVIVMVWPTTTVVLQPSAFLSLLGLALMILTAFWAIPLLALIGVRFRDTSHAFQAVMRFLFFATPVFWLPSGLGQRAYLATFNPLAHYLSVVRDPLLGETVDPLSWAVVAGITVTGALVSLLALGRFRREIVFWL